jgi:predicted phosphodiesterase
MKLCIISDLHSYHEQVAIPECDVLICAGDITFSGELKTMESFSAWLKKLPIKNKLIIFGNHETGQKISEETKKKQSDSRIEYLKNNKPTSGIPCSDQKKQLLSNLYKGRTWRIVDGKRVWSHKK